MNKYLMTYRLIMLVAGLLVGVPCMAQRISFETDIVDVGTTLWRKPVTVVFEFTNRDREPLVIDDVDAGCGCMEVDWTKGAIGKGEKGKITITYDAQMLGTIDRVINVHTNASEHPVRIRLIGVVSTGEDANIEGLYPFSVGEIMLSTDNVEFPDVRLGDSTTVSFELFNASKEVFTPQLMHMPAYVTAEFEPEMLGRGRRGTVTLTLHGSKMNNVGVNQTNIYLSRFPGDKVSEENAITLTSVLLPQVPVTNALLAPKFEISTTELDFGDMGRKKKKTGKLKISNTGRGVLNIESMEVYNQALQVSLPTRTLAPGQTITMKVTLDTRYLGKSKAQPRVLIITNDAKRQKEIVTVKYN